MAVKMTLVLNFVATGISLSSASAVLGKQGNFLESGSSMQPEVVAKTLGMVQNEWKAQVAIFSECDATSKLPGSPIVNCKDAHSSFDRSCNTIVGAIVQGSGGEKAVTDEYMGDVCSQNTLSGWHQVQCRGLALAVVNSMSADKYQNRENFNTAKLCTSLWSRFVGERAQQTAKEQADKEAADKKAAEEDKEELEAAKQEADRKQKAEEEHKKQEAVTKAAEVQAKVAEAAAKSEEKKAEAAAMAAAAKLKMAEAADAEKAHRDMAKKVETKVAPKVIKEAPKKAVVEATAVPEKTVSASAVEPQASSKKEVAVKAGTPAKAAVVSHFLVAAAAPAGAAAGAPGGAAGAPGAVENLNEKMPLKAAEQGFTGKKVKHQDGKTSAADWQNEYATK